MCSAPSAEIRLAEVDDGRALDDLRRTGGNAVEVLLKVGRGALRRLGGAGLVLEDTDAGPAIRGLDEVVGDEPVDTPDELLDVLAARDELVDQLGAALVVTNDDMHGVPPCLPAASRCPSRSGRRAFRTSG